MHTFHTDCQSTGIEEESRTKNELINTNGANSAVGYKWATPHGKYLNYNFAYWDGHVVSKNVNTTYKQSTSPSGKEWSMNPND